MSLTRPAHAVGSLAYLTGECALEDAAQGISGREGVSGLGFDELFKQCEMRGLSKPTTQPTPYNGAVLVTGYLTFNYTS